MSGQRFRHAGQFSVHVQNTAGTQVQYSAGTGGLPCIGSRDQSYLLEMDMMLLRADQAEPVRSQPLGALLLRLNIWVLAVDGHVNRIYCYMPANNLR